MKKLLALILALMMGMTALAGCGKDDTKKKGSSNDDEDEDEVVFECADCEEEFDEIYEIEVDDDKKEVCEDCLEEYDEEVVENAEKKTAEDEDKEADKEKAEDEEDEKKSNKKNNDDEDEEDEEDVTICYGCEEEITGKEYTVDIDGDDYIVCKDCKKEYDEYMAELEAEDDVESFTCFWCEEEVESKKYIVDFYGEEEVCEECYEYYFAEDEGDYEYEDDYEYEYDQEDAISELEEILTTYDADTCVWCGYEWDEAYGKELLGYDVYVCEDCIDEYEEFEDTLAGM